MRLCSADIANRQMWEEKGFELPKYDREKVIGNTLTAPTWVHFGAGNIFRGFPAAVMQEILNRNEYDKGIIVAEGFDYEIIDKAYKPYEDYSLLVLLKASGSIEKKVIGSVAKSLKADIESDDWQTLIKAFVNPSLQMASFTITEKGYALKNAKGDFFPFITPDIEGGPEKTASIMGKVAALCYQRFLAGGTPIALVSMDNCSHNGDKLKAAISTFSKIWEEKGLVEQGFDAYINDPSKVSFPWSMIDKITPRPDDGVTKMLNADGFTDTDVIITAKNTYTAPFVNAEEAQYLVIEDLFPNGRPPLEKGGVIFTDRETVNNVEKMKVCTCLNPLHTALAVYGCLLSYKTIFEEMRDEELKKLVNGIGYVEGLPVVVNPGIIDPQSFIKEVLEVRFPNPFMPDAPQRIATDTSQKLSIRFGETIKAYQNRDDLKVSDLKLIPLVFAGWLRYLMGVSDDGEKFEVSPDPLMDTLLPHLEGFSLGNVAGAAEKLKPILENESIFGVNLYTVGMADTVVSLFEELTAEKGAVRATLKKYL